MKQYIDKAAVVAEINRVLNSYDPNEITSGRYALVGLRNFLDTLEVKEFQKKKLYVVTRCEEHSDYVEKVFFSDKKAEEYCKQFEKERLARLLNKMYEWLKDNIKDYVFVHSYSSNVNVDIDTLVEDLQKSMEEKV